MHSSARTANLLGALGIVLADALADAGGDSEAAALVAIGGPSAGASIEALSAVVGLSHSGTVRLVDRLEAAGQVRRVAGRDGRSTAVRLTAAGRRAAGRVTSGRAAELHVALQVLTSHEQEQLADLAGRVLAGLRRDGAEKPVERWTCRLCDTTACGRLQGRCPVAGAHPPAWEHR